MLSTSLPINYHGYLNLISRNFYLELKEVLPHDTFPIHNLTLGLKLDFERCDFPNKKLPLGFIFYSNFHYKKSDNSIFFSKINFSLKKLISSLSGDACKKYKFTIIYDLH